MDSSHNPIERRVENFLGIADLPHPQVTERINGEDVLLDVKIAPLVVLLNSFPGYQTISSCQGSIPDPERSIWDAHVAIRGGTLYGLFRLGTHKLRRLTYEADVWVSLSVNNESEPTLWLNFPQGCIPKAKDVLRRILE